MVFLDVYVVFALCNEVHLWFFDSFPSRVITAILIKWIDFREILLSKQDLLRHSKLDFKLYN